MSNDEFEQQMREIFGGIGVRELERIIAFLQEEVSDVRRNKEGNVITVVATDNANVRDFT